MGGKRTHPIGHSITTTTYQRQSLSTERNMGGKRTPPIRHIITITTYQRQSLGSIYRGITTTSTTTKYHPPYPHLPDSPSP